MAIMLIGTELVEVLNSMPGQHWMIAVAMASVIEMCELTA